MNRILLAGISWMLMVSSGCIVGERQTRPQQWPSIPSGREAAIWDEHIPVASLKEFSKLSESKELVDYCSNGYTPRLIINKSVASGLYLVHDSIADTVMIWNSVQKGGFRWDTHLRRMKIKAKRGRVMLLPKTITTSQGGNPILGVNRESLRLYRDSEGGLQVQKRENLVGLVFMLIPTYMRFWEWHRYELELPGKRTEEQLSGDQSKSTR